MRKVAVAVLLAAGLAASPAFATVEIVCTGQGVSIDLLVGHVDLLYIDRAIIEAGGKTWTSQPNQVPGTEIRVGHVFEDERQMLVDFTTDGADNIASLRVFKLSEGDVSRAGGVFQIDGVGVWVVDCSEPE
ncbi:MAG: hypothetical protein KF849_18130 [Rhizobiaceae bacterium]|nr:hypothetical protein [Rhizobiaceae bacterium]